MNYVNSNNDIFSAWSSWAQTLDGGASLREHRLNIGWMNRDWAICNQIFLDGEVTDLGDLSDRLSHAKEFAGKKKKPWVLNVCWQLLSNLEDSSLKSFFEKNSLSLIGEFTGMEAHRLNEPARPLPALDYRKVETKEDGDLYGEINAAAYGIPRELGTEALNSKAMWTQGSTVGVVGFHQGVPATCASTVRINSNDAYLAIVATRPGLQRKGFAEAAMRKSLESAFSGGKYDKAILHATPEGRPLYEKIGFKRVADFKVFLPNEFMH